MDEVWWEHYMPEIRERFGGELCAHGPRAGVRHVRAPYYRESGQNSGAGAIALAVEWGARRVILLGYDCKTKGGRRHWHGDHPKRNRKGKLMGNAGKIADWPDQFRKLVLHIRGATVINATRETALAVFPKVSLEEALA